MKSAEMPGMSDEQIQLSLADAEKQLFTLRFQSATDRLETPSEIRKTKKDIARIKGEQRRRELVALAATPADALPNMVADLHAKAGGRGKRRVMRSINRLEQLRSRVTPTVQALPAKGK